MALRGPRVGWGPMTDRLVWIDCEMTGLDPVADALVEVAALVTDYEPALAALAPSVRRLAATLEPDEIEAVSRYAHVAIRQAFDALGL